MPDVSTAAADVLDQYAAFTIFVPLLNNVTGPEAAAFPQLSPNLVLPTVYNSVSAAAHSWQDKCTLGSHAVDLAG